MSAQSKIAVVTGGSRGLGKIWLNFDSIYSNSIYRNGKCTS
ncbi:hypothetical protein [Flavobacterium flavigenum]|nr:hypothetical protein [Flavobacterium flavigenum]